MGRTLFSTWVISLGVLAVLSGCASSSVIVGKVRPAIQPEQVKLYLHPPQKYEEIAIVDASSRSSVAFTDQQKMNRVIERLKNEAAKVGANGILIQGLGDQQAGSFGTGTTTYTGAGHTAYGTGVGVSGGIFIKSGQGLAIYVSED